MLASRLGQRFARMAALLLLAGLYACSTGSQQVEEVLETQQEDSGKSAKVEVEGNAAEVDVSETNANNVETNKNYSLDKGEAEQESYAEGSDFAENSKENGHKLDADGFVDDAENSKTTNPVEDAEMNSEEIAANTAAAPVTETATSTSSETSEKKTSEIKSREAKDSATSSASSQVSAADAAKAQKNIEPSTTAESKATGVADKTNPKQKQRVSQVNGKSAAAPHAAVTGGHSKGGQARVGKKSNPSHHKKAKARDSKQSAQSSSKKSMNLADDDQQKSKAKGHVIGDGFVYTVKKGDTLSQISREVYGRFGKWKKIAEHNKLGNTDLIFPGQKLSIPKLEGVDLRLADSKSGKSEQAEAEKADVKQADTEEKAGKPEQQKAEGESGEKSASHSQDPAILGKPSVPGVVWEKPGDYSSVRPDGFATITVKPGFSITKIAEVMFGDPQQWRKVMEFNNLDSNPAPGKDQPRLYVGQRIKFTVPVTSSQLPMVH